MSRSLGRLLLGRTSLEEGHEGRHLHDVVRAVVVRLLAVPARQAREDGALVVGRVLHLGTAGDQGLHRAGTWLVDFQFQWVVRVAGIT